MRILHVYRTYFPDQNGGLLEAIRQICLATTPRGANCRVFALSPKPHPARLEVGEGEIFRGKSLCAPASCDVGSLTALRQFREMSKWADIIHFHFPWPFADVLRFFADQSTPIIMTYHSDIVRQRFISYLYGPLMRFTLRKMSCVVATSPIYAKTSPVLRNYVDPKFLKIIPLGMADFNDGNGLLPTEKEYLQKIGVDGEQFVLSLGVLRYYKGLHNLLAAASKIKAKIVIAGSGPEEARLRTLVADMDSSDVIFVGKVTESEKVALLKGCRVLAMPSHLRSEAFGMVQIEASMFAKPLVCCKIGSGTSFVNVDGVTGFVVSPGEPNSLAHALNTLITNDKMAKEMGLAARRRYEEKFTNTMLGEAYMKLYEELSC